MDLYQVWVLDNIAHLQGLRSHNVKERRLFEMNKYMEVLKGNQRSLATLGAFPPKQC